MNNKNDFQTSEEFGKMWEEIGREGTEDSPNIFEGTIRSIGKKSGVPDIAINNSDTEFFNGVEKTIVENMRNPDYTLVDLAKTLCVSRSQLLRKFKAITNTTPSDFLKIKRLKFGAELIAQKKYTISQIAFDVGFSSDTYFNTSFKKHFGKTPKEYEKEI